MPNVPSSILTADNLATGFDRNDGLNGRGGVATLAGQIVVHAAGGVTSIDNIPINELDDSPTIERGEQCTLSKHYEMSYVEAINRLTIYGRGTLTRDSAGNYYRVLTSTAQRQKAGKALFGYQAESVSFDVPPDLFSVRPVTINVDILKHPRYFFALMPTNQIPGFTGTSDTNDQINAKQAIIRAIQAYRENPFLPTTSNINGMTGLLHDQITANLASGKFTISKTNPNFKPNFRQTDPIDVGTSAGAPPVAATVNGDPNPAIVYYSVNTTTSDPNGKVALALAAAKELLGKLWRMEDSIPITGVELEWSEYSFRPPFFNFGGYVENPINATPGLPDYFYSTAYPPNPSQTIFDAMSYINPQVYSATGVAGGGTLISWRRDADTLDYERTWNKVTRRWTGATIGAWDTDLFTQANRPALPTDYRNLIIT